MLRTLRDSPGWISPAGFLTCHNFFERNEGPEPPLRFIPLPDGCEERVGRADLDKTRCVGMSAGSLRYVQIHRRGADPIVSMWTLLDWDDARSWRRDSTISFSLIWADSGYRAMELPEVVPTGSPAGATDLLPDEVPAVAFIDPDHGHTVYFLLRSRLFGVDVRTGKFLRWQHFKMDHPPSRYHSSRFVRLWNLSQEIFNNACMLLISCLMLSLGCLKFSISVVHY